MKLYSAGLFGDYDKRQLIERYEESIPEIKLINRDLRKFWTALWFEERAPDYFWTAPAAKRHHPPDERGRGGLLLHTRRVMRITDEMCRTSNWDWSKGEQLPYHFHDYAIMAACFHDSMSRGTDEDEGYKISDHPSKTYQELIAFGFPRSICEAVRTHHGKWGPDGENPGLPVSIVVHQADYLCSRKYVDIDVKDSYTPASEDNNDEIPELDPDWQPPTDIEKYRDDEQRDENK